MLRTGLLVVLALGVMPAVVVPGGLPGGTHSASSSPSSVRAAQPDPGASRPRPMASRTALGAGPRQPPAQVAHHAYGPQPRQRLTAYWHPGDRAPRAGVVILHGGFWAKDTDWSRWARTYADAGYAVFDLYYRLNSDAVWPAQRDDALRALRWIRTHAADYSLDPDRLVLLGSSAGGQIAASVATHGAGRKHVAGAVALSPVASPYRAWLTGGLPDATPDQRKLRLNAELLTGCPPRRADARCWAAWRSAVVKNAASGADDAPMLLVHSAQDWVSVEHSTDLATAEWERGMPRADLTLDVVPGAAHGMRLLDDAAVRGRVAAWIAARTS
ncbi:alpha/beta hydrolase [Streptomyces boninensis]|uniref:alpha/beta hydrolase n=1 Tax=Streptomyces boninensis TaxID=2039455 RepID=UPI003B217F04